MTPEEWTQGIQNEAEHAADPAWARDTRAHLRAELWKRHLAAFGLGLLIVQAMLLLQTLRAPALWWLAQRGGADSLFPLANLTDLVFAVGAFAGAALLGRAGYRPWPVALGLGSVFVVGCWTEGLLALAHDAGLWHMVNPYWSWPTSVHLCSDPLHILPVVLLCAGFGLVGFLGALLGARGNSPLRRTG